MWPWLSLRRCRASPVPAQSRDAASAPGAADATPATCAALRLRRGALEIIHQIVEVDTERLAHVVGRHAITAVRDRREPVPRTRGIAELARRGGRAGPRAGIVFTVRNRLPVDRASPCAVSV